jgi:protein SCO1/2
MMKSDRFSRRAFLQGIVIAPQVLSAHGKITPPVPVPDFELLRYDGARTRLLPAVKGRVTALHLMFTSCTTTCPMQAAIFRKVQDSMPGMQQSGFELLSVSIDPLNDTPAAMSAWLKMHHAGPAWIAAAPRPSELADVQAFFGKTSTSADHSTQVHIIDRDGRLVWRTFELPSAGEIVSILKRVAAQ